MVILVSIVFNGCVSLGPSKTMPLRGQYPINRTITLSGNFEDIWQYSVAFLVAHNFIITVIDKDSGFMQTATINMGNATSENPTGDLKNKKSRFVGDIVQTYYTKKQIDTLNPNSVRAAYYVTFSTKNDSVRIIHGFTGVSSQTITNQGGHVKSTGVFEKQLEAYIQAAVK